MEIRPRDDGRIEGNGRMRRSGGRGERGFMFNDEQRAVLLKYFNEYGMTSTHRRNMDLMQQCMQEVGTTMERVKNWIGSEAVKRRRKAGLLPRPKIEIAGTSPHPKITSPPPPKKIKRLNGYNMFFSHCVRNSSDISTDFRQRNAAVGQKWAELSEEERKHWSMKAEDVCAAALQDYTSYHQQHQSTSSPSPSPSTSTPTSSQHPHPPHHHHLHQQQQQRQQAAMAIGGGASHAGPTTTNSQQQLVAAAPGGIPPQSPSIHQLHIQDAMVESDIPFVEKTLLSIQEKFDLLESIGFEGYGVLVNTNELQTHFIATGKGKNYHKTRQQLGRPLENPFIGYVFSDDSESFRAQTLQSPIAMGSGKRPGVGGGVVSGLETMQRSVLHAFALKYKVATGRSEIPYDNLQSLGVQVYGMPPDIPFHSPLLYNQQQLQQLLANLEKIVFLKETNPLSEVEIASETVAAALGHEMHLAGGGSGAGTEEDNPHTHAHAHAHGQ